MPSQSTLSITILADNIASPPYIREHGFSVFIETSGKKLLFDTGQGQSFIHNARLQNIDPSVSEALVISHGHYDHTGGIGELLKINPYLKVFFHNSALVTRYSFKEGVPPKNISVTEKNKNILSTLPDSQKKSITEQTQIAGTVFLTGPIPRTHPLEDSGGNFYFDTHMKEKDPVNDEISLWISSNKGAVIVTGCCHAGLINTCELVKKQSGQKIYAIIGGLHLHSASEERLKKTAGYINSSGIQKVIACHCTGSDAVTYLKEQSSVEIVEGFVGYSLIL